MVIDLTPAAKGPFVCPPVNLGENLESENANKCLHAAVKQRFLSFMQSTKVADVTYGEIVASISSLSAGPGTRANNDEFTVTTRKAIEKVGGADCGKSYYSLKSG